MKRVKNGDLRQWPDGLFAVLFIERRKLIGWLRDALGEMNRGLD